MIIKWNEWRATQKGSQTKSLLFFCLPFINLHELNTTDRQVIERTHKGEKNFLHLFFSSPLYTEKQGRCEAPMTMRRQNTWKQYLVYVQYAKNMLTRKACSVTILLAATMNYDYHKKSFECTFENNKCSLFNHR